MKKIIMYYYQVLSYYYQYMASFKYEFYEKMLKQSVNFKKKSEKAFYDAKGYEIKTLKLEEKINTFKNK